LANYACCCAVKRCVDKKKTSRDCSENRAELLSTLLRTNRSGSFQTNNENLFIEANETIVLAFSPLSPVFPIQNSKTKINFMLNLGENSQKLNQTIICVSFFGTESSRWSLLRVADFFLPSRLSIFFIGSNPRKIK
jgi:hypothetical protein